MNFTIEDLVCIAKRENNSKRPYLYVNPIQGKHVPTDPVMFKELCGELAHKINDKYPVDKILVIGFAETATAIALEVSMCLNKAVYVECTTREDNDNSEFSYFTESHSHATEQRLDTKNYKQILQKTDRIVFIEDEVTTGNTIMKLVDILKTNFANSSIEFTIASLLNSMSEEREKEIEHMGIHCIYVEKLPYEYCIDKIRNVIQCMDQIWESKINILSNVCIQDIEINVNQREITSVDNYRRQVNYFAQCVISDLSDKMKGRVLVLGTEEFMHPAIYVANRIAQEGMCTCVRTHSTTRSPILPSKTEGYPLTDRFAFKSMYNNERTTYLYNLTCYDLVIITTDAVDEDNYKEICNVLAHAGNTTVYIYKWKRGFDEK